MGIASAVAGALSGLAKPVTDVINKRTERQMALESATAKLAQQKVEGHQTLEITDAEAEALRWSKEGESWKDEFVTILIPGTIFGGTTAGAVAAAYGHTELLDGLLHGFGALTNMGIDVGFLCNAVVLAAVGLKVWRTR